MVILYIYIYIVARKKLKKKQGKYHGKNFFYIFLLHKENVETVGLDYVNY